MALNEETPESLRSPGFTSIRTTMCSVHLVSGPGPHRDHVMADAPITHAGDAYSTGLRECVASTIACAPC